MDIQTGDKLLVGGVTRYTVRAVTPSGHIIAQREGAAAHELTHLRETDVDGEQVIHEPRVAAERSGG